MMRIIFFMALALSGVSARADTWCLPPTECMGEASPIKNGSFDTCEEKCTMRDPVPVRGLDANLYDVSCVGDSSTKKYRMMMGEYTDWGGNRKAYIVTPEGTESLIMCPL